MSDELIIRLVGLDAATEMAYNQVTGAAPSAPPPAAPVPTATPSTSPSPPAAINSDKTAEKEQADREKADAARAKEEERSAKAAALAAKNWAAYVADQEKKALRERIETEVNNTNDIKAAARAHREREADLKNVFIKQMDAEEKAWRVKHAKEDEEYLDNEQADIDRLKHQQKRLLQDDLDSQAAAKKAKAQADKELTDEVTRLAQGYRQRAKDEEAGAKKKGKDKLSAGDQADLDRLIAKHKQAASDASAKVATGKSALSPGDQADLEKLIKQNKRLRDEELGASPSEGNGFGAFVTKFGTGLAGHHGGLRGMLGAGAKALGSSIEKSSAAGATGGLGGILGQAATALGGGAAGAAGGAAGGGGGAAAGAAAGAPLGPLGIAAGVILGKIVGDSIGKAAEVLMDGAKLIYASGEKYTEQGAFYESRLTQAVIDRQIKQLMFDISIGDRAGGSLSRFYTANTDLGIESQRAMLELFKLIEAPLTAGVTTLQGLAVTVSAIGTILNGLNDPTDGWLPSMTGIWTESLMAQNGILNLLYKAGQANSRMEALKNNREMLENNMRALGFGEDSFKKGWFSNSTAFAGADDYNNTADYNRRMGF
jgi:hypothetical protein